MKFDILVVGAGLAGSTAARLFAEEGKHVIVIEKKQHIAGHCYDYKDVNGITIHAYGPHIFHTNNKDVWNFVNKYSDFYYYQHRVLSYVEGMLVPFPINRDTICKLFGLKLATFEINNFLENEVKKSRFNNPPVNFRDVVVSQVGEKLYELFFKQYTIKQWGKDPEELLPDVAKRVPVRSSRDSRYFSDRYQGIPDRGYTKLVENLLKNPNISVLTGIDYFEVKDLFKPKIIVYTGELDRFFDYIYGELEYRSLFLNLKTIDTEYYQSVAVVNYPNDYDWTRITEYKHFLNEKSGKTTICIEQSISKGEPYYIVMTKENIDKRNKYMDKVKELEEKGKFVFIGRLAEYKYYNMDQVIEASMEKIKKIVK